MKHQIEIQPFTVPNFVTIEPAAPSRQDGIKALATFHIHELSDETLEGLCKEFRTTIFAKKSKHLHEQLAMASCSKLKT